MSDFFRMLEQLFARHDQHDGRLCGMEAGIKQLEAGFKRIEQMQEQMMNAVVTLQGEIGVLQAAVVRENGVIASAVVLLNGIGARIEAAIAKALANGATQQQLADLSAIATDVSTNTDALAAAVAAVPPVDPAPGTTSAPGGGGTTTSGGTP